MSAATKINGLLQSVLYWYELHKYAVKLAHKVPIPQGARQTVEAYQLTLQKSFEQDTEVFRKNIQKVYECLGNKRDHEYSVENCQADFLQLKEEIALIAATLHANLRPLTDSLKQYQQYILIDQAILYLLEKASPPTCDQVINAASE